MTTDPDPCRKAGAGVSRMLILLGPRELEHQGEIMTIRVGKAKAAGSRMPFLGDRPTHIMVTQQAFEPLVDHDFWKTRGSYVFDPARFNKRAGSNNV